MMRTFGQSVAAWLIAAVTILAGVPAAAELTVAESRIWLPKVCQGGAWVLAETQGDENIVGDEYTVELLTESDPLSGAFGARLLGAIVGDGNDNALVSPLGVGAVLAMLTQGATKPVRAAVGEVLGAGGAAAEGDGSETVASVSGEDEPGSAPPGGGPARALACQLAALPNAVWMDEQVEVQVASAVFAQQGLDVFPSFTTALREAFDAPVERLDFAEAGAVERINTWVSKTTEGAIPELVSKLEPDDALVLANAMRFRGEWAQEFDGQGTVPAPFHLRSGDAVEVPTMHADELRARYREDAGMQAIAVPYGEGEFELVVVLPIAGTEPEEAIRGLASDAGWLGAEGFRAARGSLALPRLSMGTEASLLPALRALGLEEALADGQGFAGIAAPAPRLSRVLQRTMLELDERGTEAAAATAAVMTSRTTIQPLAFEMRADRPFTLAVRYRPTGAVLFAAWVANPAQS